jgi:chromate reductase
MTQTHLLNILAISGSLKASSANIRILNEIGFLAGENVRFTIYNDLENIPAFNPDKEEGNDAVKKLRQLLKDADGVVISTPEYAFGVPGVLKNALDWTVSSGELNDKPVIAISASPLSTGGDKAMASLLPTLSALGTKMNEHSHLCIPTILTKMNAERRITDEATLAQLKNLVNHLFTVIRSGF